MSVMTRAQVEALIAATIYSNTAGEVTGNEIRDALLNVADSVLFAGEAGGSTATLNSLGAITGSADTLPYFTGASAFGTTPLTAFSRTVLDDADAAAWKATLGIAEAASWSAKAVPTGTVVGDTDTQTLTNKTIAAGSNTLSGLATSNFAAGVVDVDTTLAANSDTRLATQKAIRAYVNALLTGLKHRAPVVTMATTNITLSGEQTIQSVLTSGSRVLLIGQTTGAQNGVYVTAAGAWTRSVDMDEDAEFPQATVLVLSGTSAGTQWTCTNTAVTIGTTTPAFVQISIAGIIADASVTLAKLATDVTSIMITKTAAGVQALTGGTIVNQYRSIRMSEHLAAQGGNHQLAFNAAVTELYSSATKRYIDGEYIKLTIAPSNDIAAISGATSIITDHGYRNMWLAPTAGGTTLTFTKTGGSIAAGTSVLTLADTTSLRPGMLVTGQSIGREVYIKTVDSATAVTLSTTPYGTGAGSYVFTDHTYILDFRGFTNASRCRIQNCNFDCNALTSAVRMSANNSGTRVQDNWFNQPSNRGITFWDTNGGMELNQNQFASAEGSITPSSRVSIAMSINGGDNKIRNSRAFNFRHALVIQGSGNVIAGSHYWQSGSGFDTDRTASIVLCSRTAKTMITGSYMDNSWIEITDEDAGDNGGTRLGNVTITGNIFTVSAMMSTFNWIRLKPHHALKKAGEITVTGNVFRSITTAGQLPVTRVEGVDTSIGTLDTANMDQVYFRNNVFLNVTNPTENPATLKMVNSNSFTPTQTFTFNFNNILPWSGVTNHVLGVACRLTRNSSNTEIFPIVYALASGDTIPVVGGVVGSQQVVLRSSVVCRGTFVVTASCNVNTPATTL